MSTIDGSCGVNQWGRIAACLWRGRADHLGRLPNDTKFVRFYRDITLKVSGFSLLKPGLKEGECCAAKERIKADQRLVRFIRSDGKKRKVWVDTDRVNLSIGDLSGAHSASAPGMGIALKQHQLQDWGNPDKEVVVSSGLKYEAGIDVVSDAL